MAPSLSEYGKKQIGSAIDNLWRVRESRNRVDVTIDRENASHVAERSKMSLQHSELQQRARTGGSVSLVNRPIQSHRARQNAVGCLGDNAGKVHDIARGLRRHIVAARRRWRGQFQTKLLQRVEWVHRESYFSMQVCDPKEEVELISATISA